MGRIPSLQSFWGMLVPVVRCNSWNAARFFWASFHRKEKVCPFTAPRAPQSTTPQREVEGLFNRKRRNEMSEGKKYEQEEIVYPFSTEGMLDKAFDEIEELEKRVAKMENDNKALERHVMRLTEAMKSFINRISGL
jgi:hypothetical protein